MMGRPQLPFFKWRSKKHLLSGTMSQSRSRRQRERVEASTVTMFDERLGFQMSTRPLFTPSVLPTARFFLLWEAALANLIVRNANSINSKGFCSLSLTPAENPRKNFHYIPDSSCHCQSVPCTCLSFSVN